VEQVGEDEASRGEVLDFYGHTEAAVMAFARERLPCLAHADFIAVAPPPAAADSDPANKDEILELVKSGPPGNRIDLVFMVLAHDTRAPHARHTTRAHTTHA
jgi:hypothetical protein